MARPNQQPLDRRPPDIDPAVARIIDEIAREMAREDHAREQRDGHSEGSDG